MKLQEILELLDEIISETYERGYNDGLKACDRLDMDIKLMSYKQNLNSMYGMMVIDKESDTK